MGEDVTEGGWCFIRKRHVGPGMVDARSESEGAVVEHQLGEIGGVDMGLDAEVAEHRIGFPAAEELDPGRVNVGAHEGGSAAGTERAGAEQFPVDAGSPLETLGTVSEAVGDDGAGHSAGSAGGIVVGVEWSRGGSTVVPEMLSEPEECFRGAHDRVGVCALGDLFAADAVLLVGESQSSRGYGGLVHVIQRRVSGGSDDISYGEGDVAEAEGLGAACATAGGVFSRAEKPVEANDGEVADVFVRTSKFWVVNVEDGPEVADDRYVGRVGAFGWVVLVTEPLEESSE